IRFFDHNKNTPDSSLLDFNRSVFFVSHFMGAVPSVRFFAYLVIFITHLILKYEISFLSLDK
ncbi:hypothetical protein, partial [Streptococcus pluranimalium]|uniref:hypothetical protein n=1 Tax=Streptococcus pluranimalium TaxID=82348 RepID=UPI0039E90AE6